MQYPFVSMQPEGTMENPLYAWYHENQLQMAIGLEIDHLSTYIDSIQSGNLIGCWPGMALAMRELAVRKDLRVLALSGIPHFLVYGLMKREGYQKIKIL